MNRVVRDIAGEAEKAQPDDPKGDDVAALAMTRISIDGHAPQERAARCHLNETVDAEAHERDTAGRQSGNDADETLGAVPSNREVFEPPAAGEQQVSLLWRRILGLHRFLTIFARLTKAGRPRRIEVVSKLGRVAVVAALMCAVSSSAWASCLPNDMTDMACCKKMRDCEQTMKGADCCQARATSSEKFVALKPASVVKPLAIVSFGSSVTDVAAPMRTSVEGYGRAPVAASSPPIFLLDSSLRI